MTRLDGADLSHHQDDAGPIDWPTLRNATWWCATKATQGLDYVDPTFHAHRAQMAAQGFIHALYYHWLSSTSDPRLQAEHFLATVGHLEPGEGAMLDAEETGISVAKCQLWCETVEAINRRPGSIYTGAYVAGGTIWQSSLLRRSLFGPRAMHLAAYTTEAKAMALPGVGTYPPDAWQYSSNGPVPGVTGRCDMNRIDNRSAFDRVCGLDRPTNGPIGHPSKEETMLIRGTPGGPHADFRGDYSLGFVTNMGADHAALGFTGDEGRIVSDAWLESKLDLGLPQGPKGTSGIDGVKGDKGDKGDPGGAPDHERRIALVGMVHPDGSVVLDGTVSS